jgi:hypothetical protein
MKSRTMNLDILAPGWEIPPGHADEFEFITVTSRVGDNLFQWGRWNIPELLLSGRAALLLLQGMKLQQLFDNAGLVVEGNSSVSDGLHPGPYILVKAGYLQYNVPPKLTGVVLACFSLPGYASKEEVLGAIVQDVLAS